MSDENTHTPEITFDSDVTHDFYDRCFATNYGRTEDSKGLLAALRTCVQKHIQVFNIVSQQSSEFLEPRPIPAFSSGGGDDEEEAEEEEDE